MYRSLEEILNPRSNTDGSSRDGSKYDWERLTYDAKKIRDYHTSNTKVGDVCLDNAYIPKEIRHYAESIETVTEAYEYANGSILICAVCDEFAGTFASHSDTEIHFFLLTPKKSR